MGFVEIAADGEDGVAILDLRKGSGRGLNAERLLEPLGHPLVALASGMVEVGGAEVLVGEFLEQKVLFVGQTPAGDDADALVAAGLLESAGRSLQGLVPGGFDQLAVLAHQRAGQALVAVDERVTEATADTQVAVVDAGFVVEADRLDLVILDAEGHRAAVAAVTADAVDLVELPRPGLELEGPGQDGADRAHRDALAAELAVQSAVEGGGDLRFEAAVDEGVGAVGDDFVADTGTFAAQHATVHVALDQRVDLVGGQVEGRALEAVAVDSELVGQILQVALAALVAHRAFEHVIDQQKLQNGLADLEDIVTVGRDGHPLGDRGGTRRDKASLHLLHFHQADPAGAIGQEFLGVAEDRNIDPGFLGGFVDGRRLFYRDLLAVNRQSYHCDLV